MEAVLAVSLLERIANVEVRFSLVQVVVILSTCYSLLGSTSKTLPVFTLFEADQPRRNSFYTLAVRGHFLDLDHLDRQFFLSAQILGRCIYWQLNETDTVFVGL